MLRVKTVCVRGNAGLRSASYTFQSITIFVHYVIFDPVDWSYISEIPVNELPIPIRRIPAEKYLKNSWYILLYFFSYTEN